MRKKNARYPRLHHTIALIAWLSACGGQPPVAESSAPHSGNRPATFEAGYSEQREPCADYNPLRNAYFGDFHVHTDVSMDAYIFGTRTNARDAYRFAQGQAIPTPDASIEDTQNIQLERPLDFAAVTDHAAFLGEVKLCTTPDSPSFDSQPCKMYRGEAEIQLPEGVVLGGNAVTAELGARMAALGSGASSIGDIGRFARNPVLCGERGELCRQWNTNVWADTKAAAEGAYDRSAACSFTTFHAYEYTATPDMAKVHRNIIFRNAQTIDYPISFSDVPDKYDMWEDLREQCLQAGNGCDVVSIPHNSNLSNGRMFHIDYSDLPEEQQIARVKLRAELEPLVEIMQIKGDSECRNGLAGVVGGTDELCDFERYRPASVEWEDCGEGIGAGALMSQGCISKRDYVRYALADGLREEARLGVNPFKLGFIASTDAHNSNLGDVQEASYDGWSGTNDSTPQRRLDGDMTTLSPLAANPGGLVGVWAPENSRDALFDALKNRESFGTSGPRIQPRFFAGWNYDSDLCNTDRFIETAYADGVAMGGDLSGRPADAKSPTFLVSAARDPGTKALPGGKLQRIQIIKSWPAPDGTIHQRIHDVAGDPQNGASVDMNTCTPKGPGFDSLCAVWTDPEFDASASAVYYARVVENPSCRWSTRQCLAFPEGQEPRGCEDPDVPKLIQERAWTSPIWYTPRG
ncbi:DUF3604 domain-containing protein [Myxococcota bacterium]|nr:DUF3604 domain-containing protein [Myxococcota bacterium]